MRTNTLTGIAALCIAAAVAWPAPALAEEAPSSGTGSTEVTVQMTEQPRIEVNVGELDQTGNPALILGALAAASATGSVLAFAAGKRQG